AYLRLLTAAKLPEVHEFALRGLLPKHQAIVHAAPDAEIIALLDAPHEPTLDLGVTELERRFDPQRPNWDLLQRLLANPRQAPRDLGRRWLQQTVNLWIRDPERILIFLKVAHTD